MKLTKRQYDLLKHIRYSGVKWHAPADLPDPRPRSILHTLERKGLIERQPARWRKRYAITAAGKTLIRQFNPYPDQRLLGTIADIHVTMEEIGALNGVI